MFGASAENAARLGGLSQRAAYRGRIVVSPASRSALPVTSSCLFCCMFPAVCCLVFFPTPCACRTVYMCLVYLPGVACVIVSVNAQAGQMMVHCGL